jgi:mannose-6-phosphate isomerase-like protein (cupin superfamily)
MRLASAALFVTMLVTSACVARTAPVPADSDARWIPSTSNPALSRLDLSGSPSAAGPFRYLLRVPDGFAIATHRHNIELTAVVLRGEQHIVIEEPGKPPHTHVLKPGDRLVIPSGVPHRESWHAPTVVDLSGHGPMATTTP